MFNKKNVYRIYLQYNRNTQIVFSIIVNEIFETY